MSTVQALIDQWRAEAARINSFHATMGTGYHVCADQLAALLASPSLQMQENEEDTATRGVDTQYPSNPLATAASNEPGPTVCPECTRSIRPGVDYCPWCKHHLGKIVRPERKTLAEAWAEQDDERHGE